MRKVFFIVGMAITFTACHKDNPLQPNPSQVEVYVAGWISDTPEYASEIYPTYWKNGEVFRLNFDYTMPYDLGKQGWANSIAVSGNDIYVAGHRKQYCYCVYDLTQGLYWKNGAASEFPGSGLLEGYNQLGQIIISGNDVYTVVREYLASENIAQYMKNDNVVILDQGTGPDGSIAESIAVSGNDVYVAGAAIRISRDVGPLVIGMAKYWKNGIPVNLSDGSASAFATAIVVSGNDIYAAGVIRNGVTDPGDGYTNRRGIFWKNGVPSYLTDGTTDVSVNAMAISGNDVYIAGTQSDGKLVNGSRASVAKYWKNGVAIILSDGSNSAEANSIAISGNDVYVAGFEYEGPPLHNGFPASVAKYWKNGEPVRLSDGTSDAGANSIFLVTR